MGVKANPDGSTHAAYAGVATCSSVWSCPQCAAKIATKRGEDLADIIRRVDELGGSAYMLTLTMRHTTRDPLGWDRDQRRAFAAVERRRRDRKLAREIGQSVDEDQERADEAERAVLMKHHGCWDALSDGWAAATSGGTWVKDQQLCGGFLGWVKVVEVTHGRSGWHTHVHALLCFAGDARDDEVRPIAARMFDRWQRKLRDQGYDASGDLAQDGKVPGYDVRRAQLGDNAIANYFTKLAAEVTGGHRKEGRRPGGLTPFALAAVAVETYAERDVERWREWQRASDGRQQMTTSGTKRKANRLRDLIGLDEELTDEEIAEQTIDADERLRLSPETWGWVRSSDAVTTVLDVAELEGLDGLARWLIEHGQQFVTGAGLEWVERPPEEPGQPVYGANGQTIGWQRGVVPRDEGVGLGFATEAAPAVIREHDAAGRPRRRPSDRPPRWTEDARQFL